MKKNLKIAIITIALLSLLLVVSFSGINSIMEGEITAAATAVGIEDRGDAWLGLISLISIMALVLVIMSSFKRGRELLGPLKKK